MTDSRQDRWASYGNETRRPSRPSRYPLLMSDEHAVPGIPLAIDPDVPEEARRGRVALALGLGVLGLVMTLSVTSMLVSAAFDSVSRPAQVALASPRPRVDLPGAAFVAGGRLGVLEVREYGERVLVVYDRDADAIVRTLAGVRDLAEGVGWDELPGPGGRRALPVADAEDELPRTLVLRGPGFDDRKVALPGNAQFIPVGFSPSGLYFAVATVEDAGRSRLFVFRTDDSSTSAQAFRPPRQTAVRRAGTMPAEWDRSQDRLWTVLEAPEGSPEGEAAVVAWDVARGESAMTTANAEVPDDGCDILALDLIGHGPDGPVVRVVTAAGSRLLVIDGGALRDRGRYRLEDEAGLPRTNAVPLAVSPTGQVFGMWSEATEGPARYVVHELGRARGTEIWREIAR